MLPKIFIFDSYVILILIGIIACFILLEKYFDHNKTRNKDRSSYEILGVASIIIGIIFAMLFQYIYDLIKNPNAKFSFSMTFYGGLIGGVGFFLLIYFIYLRKRVETKIITIVEIAPACITLAHGFGRIGCFLAGCCYGIKTTSFLGVQFPHLDYKVHPTQLYEAIFLFLLAFVLGLLAYKGKGKNTLAIYLISYGIFRFLIEFIRGDYRGFFFIGLSPSQLIALILILIGLGLLLISNKTKLFDYKKNELA